MSVGERLLDGVRATLQGEGHTNGIADAREHIEAADDGARIRDEVRVTVTSDKDIVRASRRGRKIAEDSGFASSDPTLIATAISELARNIFWYATQGEIILRLIENGAREGIEVVALDEGPGIHDVSLAMQAGYSTSGSLGLGLPGIRRLMDEFKIISRVGEGTTVTVRKWKR